MTDLDISTDAFAPTLGWSKFAASRHQPGTGYSFFTGYTNADVVDLVRRNWSSATPGDGETDLKRKAVVPIPAENFYCTSVPLAKGMELHSEVYEHNKDFAIKTVARAKAVPAKFVNVVCFSAECVQASFGQRSCDSEWEIIVILAAEAEHVPMHPLSMARNLLEAPDATASQYTAREFAESIHYWSQKVQVSGE